MKSSQDCSRRRVTLACADLPRLRQGRFGFAFIRLQPRRSIHSISVILSHTYKISSLWVPEQTTWRERFLYLVSALRRAGMRRCCAVSSEFKQMRVVSRFQHAINLRSGVDRTVWAICCRPSCNEALSFPTSWASPWQRLKPCSTTAAECCTVARPLALGCGDHQTDDDLHPLGAYITSFSTNMSTRLLIPSPAYITAEVAVDFIEFCRI